MNFRSSETYLLFCLAICALTVGTTRANADTVALSNGAIVSGEMVLSISNAGVISLDTAVPWAYNSTDTPFPLSHLMPTSPSWTNTNNLGLGLVPLTGFSGQPYTLLGLTNTLDSNGTGLQSSLSFAVPGTVSQFVALLNGLPVGQSIQLQLLTVGQGGCTAGSCSGETDFEVVNGQSGPPEIENIVGPAFITITNDPGVYDVAVTSTPLNPPTPAPEPASLLLLGMGVVGLFFVRGSSLEKALRSQ